MATDIHLSGFHNRLHRTRLRYLLLVFRVVSPRLPSNVRLHPRRISITLSSGRRIPAGLHTDVLLLLLLHRRATRQYQRFGPPEERLIPGLIATFFVPVGHFLFGAGLSSSISCVY